MNLSNNNDKNKIGPAGCPICPSCFCILCIRLSSSKINLYCDRCSFSEKYEVDDNIINTIFINNNFTSKQILNDVQCEKCLKNFCSECYVKHNDVVNGLLIDEKKFIHDKKNYNRITFQEQLTYTNYNIRCEKCNRQYLSDLINPNMYQKNNFYSLLKDLQKGKDYLNNYYTDIKKKIINELEEKIKLIENVYQKNYNYQINIFRIIDKLIEIYNVNNSNAIYKSLFNFSNISFPEITTSNISSIEQKIITVKTFYENKFIIKPKCSEKEKFYSKFQILELYNPKNIYQFGKHKIIYNDGFSIKVYNLSDFSFDYVIPFPFVMYVAPINDETIVFGTEEKVYICYLKQNEYKIQKIKNIKEEIMEILILRDNRILIIGETNLVFLKSTPPYKVTKKLNYSGDFISQLWDNRFILLNQGRDTVLTIDYFNENGNKVNVYSKKLKAIIESFSIDKKGMLYLFFSKKIIFFNLLSNQIESNLTFNAMICRVKMDFPDEERFGLIFRDSLKIYTKRDYQQIFVFRHQLNFLTNFILLNNGTLLGFYDWNARYLSKEERGADSWDYFETDKTGPDEKFVIELKNNDKEESIDYLEEQEESEEYNESNFTSHQYQNKNNKNNNCNATHFKINIEDLNDKGVNDDNGSCY